MIDLHMTPKTKPGTGPIDGPDPESSGSLLGVDPGPFQWQTNTISRSAHRIFLLTVGLSLFTFMLWASLVRLDTVTRGEGRIVPSANNQMVQHFEGGIVTAIQVREGDRVERDEVLLVIEDQFSEAELDATRLDIQAKRVRLARLNAEAQGRDEFTTPYADSPQLRPIVDSETVLFQRRRQSLRERIGILEDQIRQRELELGELKSRLENTRLEGNLSSERVASLRRLTEMGAVSKNELLKNETALQQITTRIADLEFQIPRTEAGLSEVVRRRNEAILMFRSEAERERADVELDIAKLEERSNALVDREVRAEVRAPATGVINRLNVKTLGGVVRPGQIVAEIVPSDSAITVEARLSPEDRAEVWPGLPAIVKITAYDYSIYGGIRGKVIDISPDALTGDSGQPYFRVRLEADASELGQGNPVVPGMLAEVDILTSEHTILSYLMQPVNRMRERALRQ